MNLADQTTNYELIKRARHQHALMAPSKASPETQQAYAREWERLVGKKRGEADAIWKAVCQTDKKRTYYRRVAAVRHMLRIKLGRCLQHQDLCQRAQDWNGWQNELKEIAHLLDLDKLVTAAAGHCPLEDPKPRSSKRRHLTKFPADWREQLARKFRGSQYEGAVLCNILSGCRPHELQTTGINVSRTPDGGAVISVRGAKVKDNTQGQEWRKLRYESHPYIQRLLEILDVPPGAVVPVKVGSKVSYTSAVRRAGWSLWPNVKKDITPILFRHSLISDMKYQGWNPDEISATLGHISAKTRSLYGHRNLGGNGSLGLKEVTAAKPIRSANRKNSFSIPTPKRGPQP